jgi:hypothetical protein
MTDLPFELVNLIEVDDFDEDDDEAPAIELDPVVLDEACGSVDYGGSPGKSVDGTYYLVLVQGRSRVFHHSGGETSDEGDLQADSDEGAIRLFRAGWA